MIKISLRETIIIILISLAYGLFAYFSLQAVFDYKKEFTAFNQELSTHRELPMPTITVCSQNIFKNVSNKANTDTVLQNLNDHVYTWGDLFDKSLMPSMMASPYSLWNNNHEIFSNTLGLCYSLSSDKNATSQPPNFMFFYLFLPVGKKYQV